MDASLARVVIDTNICNGKPTIRGTRIAVQSILEYLAAGDTPQEILHDYPMLTSEDIFACLTFASSLMNRTYIVQSFNTLQAA